MLTQFPQNAKEGSGSNPILPKRNRKRRAKLSGPLTAPRWIPVFLTDLGAQECSPYPSTAGSPSDRFSPSEPLPGLPPTQGRSAERQPPLALPAHPSRRVRSPRNPAPPELRGFNDTRLAPPKGWVPAGGKSAVPGAGAEAVAGGGEDKGSGRPGVQETLRRQERGLGGAGQYLSSWDPPLRVTRPAVHCGAGEGPIRGAVPHPTWLAAAGSNPTPVPQGDWPRPIRFNGKNILTRPAGA